MDLAKTASQSKSANFLNRFNEVRGLTEELCEPLQPEDFVVQPVVDVSPPKWHLGHTTWFFENFILKDNFKGYQLFDKDYPFLFNSYYETEGDRWVRAERGMLTRPWVNEILQYRSYVNENMSQFLSEQGLPEELYDAFEIGLQHEQQHQELMVYDIKHILGINPLYPVYRSKASDSNKPDLTENFLEVDEGVYEVGYDGENFHFDNEEGKHKVYLHGYKVLDRLVTAGEYLEFMEAGGYEDFNHWLMEGFEWAKKLPVKAPFYWFQRDGRWMNYTMAGLEPVDLGAPITHISFYEADAYAKWKGMRLPTEFEWEVACKKHSPEIPDTANFLENRAFRTLPRKAKDYQFYGDAWEWTNSAYLPYPQYSKIEGALGEYNGKFMVNQMVLRGGSFATMKNHIRPTYRNFFHPHLRWHFTGLRLAQNL